MYLNRVNKAFFLIALLGSVFSSAQAPQPHLFRVVHYSMKSMDPLDFISLSEIYGYQYSEAGYEKVIEQGYLDSNASGGSNYHLLSANKRALFLERCGIEESDCLYLMDFNSNEVEIMEIQDLKASAFLNVYESGARGPFPEYYYMIGLEIPSENIQNDGSSKYGGSLAMFGQDNPFLPEQLELMEFDSISCASIPSFLDYFPKTDTSCHCFEYRNDSMNFYVHEFNSAYLYPTSRGLLILNSGDSSLVRQMNFRDSEGSYLPRLNVKGRRHRFNQWTGSLLKYKGPIVLGYIGFSFGCERLHFTDSMEAPIYILCDNRH